MERRNYFEILGLEFDPPEKNPKKIEKAIEEWQKRLQDLIANETNEVRRTAIKAELALKEDIEKTLKETKSRNLEAKSLKEKQIGQLEKLIEIMCTGETGTLEVTNAQIRNVSLKLKLSTDTVEGVYTQKGFVVQKVTQKVNLKDVFMAKPTADHISEKIQQLRVLDYSQYGISWTKKVTDLFEFACYYSGGSDSDVNAYRKKRIAELVSIMEAGSSKYASDMSDQGHLLNDLFTIGQTKVFNSEENRKKYQMTQQREKLGAFFGLLISAPDDFKKDRYFAESCIRTIQKQFPDYNLALALYNQEAGLSKDPYEPIEALIRVSCPSCSAPAEFRTRQDAEKGQCPTCGAKLYITCPCCGKKAPAAADRCSCGFQISEIQFFDDYLRAAQLALSNMDLLEAEKQLQNAKNANPGHPKLAALEQQLRTNKDKFMKPLNELKTLISTGQFMTAQTKLAAISASMPKLNLDSQRKVINERLETAKKRMLPDSAPPADRANRCEEILQDVVDFRPALEMLMTIPPRSPLHLTSVTRNDGKSICTLSWAATGDKGVKYQIVRKKNGTPVVPSDGDVLVSDATVLEYTDTTIQPGVNYGYSVFACRRGIYSKPASCEAEIFSELDPSKIRAVAEDGVCRFSWVLPANCVGVRIIRRTNALPSTQLGMGSTIVVERAAANFDDKTVVNGNDYGYRLQCVYPYKNGFTYSNGWTTLLRPDVLPLSVRNVTAKIDGRNVTIQWTPPDAVQRNITIREVKNSNVANHIGQVMAASDINAMLGGGRMFYNTTSSAKQCSFEVPANSAVSLAVITIAGSMGIVSDVVQVSSVEKCEIHKQETRIEGDRLKIILAKLPRYLDRIHYSVAQKVNSRVPWSTIDDAVANNTSVISVSNYTKDGMILIERLPKADLYVTVIGQYKMPDGTIAYSDPSKLRINNKPKEKITYQMTWGKSWGSSRANNAKLIVNATAQELPEIKLVYRTDGHIPNRLDGPKTVVLHTVPENESGYPGGQYIYNFPDSTWTKAMLKSELRLLLNPDDMIEYEVTPSDVASLKIPAKT